MWVVDHVDGDIVAVEIDGTTLVTFPKGIFPDGVGPNDVFRVERERSAKRSVLTMTRDDQERERRLARSRAQTSVRSKNDRPGNITL